MVPRNPGFGIGVKILVGMISLTAPVFSCLFPLTPTNGTTFHIEYCRFCSPLEKLQKPILLQLRPTYGSLTMGASQRESGPLKNPRRFITQDRTPLFVLSAP